jgi:four helix bundle protein
MVAREAAHATTVAVMPNRDLKLLDAADRVADLINELIDRSPHGRLLHVAQMRKSVQSIGANISEGFGRGKGRDRDRPLEIARGETEETIRHLSANFRTNRIAPKDYWPRHNLLVVIAKMLTSILGD